MANVGTSSPTELGIVGNYNTLYLYYAQPDESTTPSWSTSPITVSLPAFSVDTVELGLMLQAGSNSNDSAVFTNVESSGAGINSYNCPLVSSAALGLPVPTPPATQTNPLDTVSSAINNVISSLKKKAIGNLNKLEKFIEPAITGLITAPTQSETFTISGSAPVTGIAAGVDVSVGLSGSVTVSPTEGSSYGVNASLTVSIGISAGLQVDLPSLSVTNKANKNASQIPPQNNVTSLTFAASLDAAAGIGVAEVDWSDTLASVTFSATNGIGGLSLTTAVLNNPPTVTTEVGWTGLIGVSGGVDLSAKLGFSYTEPGNKFRQGTGGWINIGPSSVSV